MAENQKNVKTTNVESGEKQDIIDFKSMVSIFPDFVTVPIFDILMKRLCYYR